MWFGRGISYKISWEEAFLLTTDSVWEVKKERALNSCEFVVSFLSSFACYVLCVACYT